MSNFMIYGANGYTGRIITQMAAERGLKPLLCGRNEAAISALAAKYKLPYAVCDLSNKAALDDAVLSVDAVLHCAGPFSRTTTPMLESCIRTKTHYLDITGELEVFEKIARQDIFIAQGGITAMPGVGFDVVPTDCLAAYLKKRLPTATHLTLAFVGLGGGVSHGTATTMLENTGKGGAIRLNGNITPIPNGSKTKMVTFDKKPVETVCIPWGDVSTAYYSTKIPNIEVYTVFPSMMKRVMAGGAVSWLLTNWLSKKLLQRFLNGFVDGPSEKQRANAKSIVWGQVSDENGNIATARLLTPEGYTLTALTALAAVEKVLQGKGKLGFQTPSMAFGENFVTEIKGVVRQDLHQKTEVKVQ